MIEAGKIKANRKTRAENTREKGRRIVGNSRTRNPPFSLRARLKINAATHSLSSLFGRSRSFPALSEFAHVVVYRRFSGHHLQRFALHRCFCAIHCDVSLISRVKFLSRNSTRFICAFIFVEVYQVLWVSLRSVKRQSMRQSTLKSFVHVSPAIRRKRSFILIELKHF